MDITSQELKTMKSKQLRRIIREAIEEILAEAPQKTTIDYKNPSQPDKVLDIEPSDAATINKLKSDSNVGSITMGNKKIKEGELAEMAMGNKLSDENMDLSPFANQMLSGRSLKDILTYIKENPGATEKQIADEFKFTRQQPINALMKALRDKEIVTRLDKSGEVIAPKTSGEEGDEEEVVTGPEAFFIGKGDPLAQYFDDKPNADGSEDFEETEPETPAAKEPFKAVGPVAKAAEFTTDNDRLIDKIIKLYGASKLRVKEAIGDSEISGADFTKAEKGRKEAALNKLPELIQQLADKISMEDKETQDAILAILAKKFASVNYSSLSKKVAAALGTTAPQVQEPEMDDLESEDEEEIEPLDEYTKRKLQFYAGIIK
jgi:hypothetical protein